MIWENSTINQEMIVEAAGEEDQEAEGEEDQVDLEESLEHQKYLFNSTDCLEYLLLEDNKIP